MTLYTDSTAAMGVCNRQGLGQLRHIATHTLWVQEKVQEKAFTLRKVPGKENPADLFTKYLPSGELVAKLVEWLGGEYRDGRADAAPKLKT